MCRVPVRSWRALRVVLDILSVLFVVWMKERLHSYVPLRCELTVDR